MPQKYCTTPQHYRKYMFIYGILSALFILEHYQELEEYEECKKIIDAIKEQEERLDITLFTRVTKECINEVIETYKKYNLTGDNAVDNSKYYAGLIINEIESKYAILIHK